MMPVEFWQWSCSKRTALGSESAKCCIIKSLSPRPGVGETGLYHGNL
jgi:hypothetical protein